MTTICPPVERIYAVSDVHGHLPQLRAAFDLVDLEHDLSAELLLLGDYVDRGPRSAEVLDAVRQLQQSFPERVTALLGNHDDWFLGWLDGDDDDFSWLMADADLVTVKSFLEPVELAHALGHDDPDSDVSTLDGPTMNRNLKRAVLTKHSDLIDWVRGLPRLHETENQIFVHAGVDEAAGELWRAATPDRMLTEKYPPSFGPFSKTVIAGHVRTAEMHADGSHGVYHDGASHYFIDGSVEVTGKVNVLRYTVADGTYEFSVADPTNYAPSFVIADSLGSLWGPTGGEVTLPNRLQWNQSRPFDLSDDARLRSMIRIVLREARSQDDLAQFVDRDSLVRLWPTLGLPQRTRAAWEARFPELGEIEQIDEGRSS